MQGTTRRRKYQLVWLALHGLVVVSILGLALVGQMLVEAGGWVVRPAVCAGSPVRAVRRRAGHRVRSWAGRLRVMRRYLAQSWQLVMLRSLLLWGLWAWSSGRGAGWWQLIPWGLWLWRGLAVGWPGLRGSDLWRWIEQALWQAQRLLVVGYLGLALRCLRQQMEQLAWPVGSGCVVCGQEEPWVKVERQADGSYRATLCGHFTLAMASNEPFRMRLLIVFLNLLDASTAPRASRRTREGRTPFVRQQQMAAWFDVPQPDISRWLRYWLAGDWANLLSLHSAEVLTAELIARIVTVLATFPTWSIEHAHAYLPVFEKVYRFTPFSQDAQPRIRNHCPLQLAGYDVSHLPMATLCAGLSILWPLQPMEAIHVPSPSRSLRSYGLLHQNAL